MADIEMCERRLEKAQKAAKGGDKHYAHEIELLQALLEHLNAGKLARTFDCDEDDMALIAESDLLTLKKTIYAANLGEDEVSSYENSRHYQAVAKLAAEEGSQVLPICAKLEADIAELDDPEEKAMFLEELGIAESGLDRLIKCSYTLLGLISFLTAGSDECRAWTIRQGTNRGIDVSNYAMSEFLLYNGVQQICRAPLFVSGGAKDEINRTLFPKTPNPFL